MPLPTFSFSTTAEEVAVALADQISGKNVLITGTSIGGIGFETARVIAKYADLVVITGHSVERRRAKELPAAHIRALFLDLSSMAAVRTAAAEVNGYPEPIHVLINNAAATIGPFKLTVDGLESQMATNHVGHFLFTTLIAPKIRAAKTPRYTPRVVFVSSDVHAFCDGVDLDAIEHPRAEAYETWQAYCRTKAALILTALELSRRARGALRAYSLMPGAIYTNILLKEESRECMHAQGVVDADGTPNNKTPLVFKTIPQGAATTVVAAFDPRLEDKSGAYLRDCVDGSAGIAPHSSDSDTAAKLWALTEKLVGEPFVFP
ncbi:hypothetical protein B0H11DRAFT_1846543 [Mycena galericulata]|nr:hypothetical protein B0H11DRAFT_1846543 [Mycena galericulata]